MLGPTAPRPPPLPPALTPHGAFPAEAPEGRADPRDRPGRFLLNKGSNSFATAIPRRENKSFRDQRARAATAVLSAPHSGDTGKASNARAQSSAQLSGAAGAPLPKVCLRCPRRRHVEAPALPDTETNLPPPGGRALRQRRPFPRGRRSRSCARPPPTLHASTPLGPQSPTKSQTTTQGNHLK